MLVLVTGTGWVCRSASLNAARTGTGGCSCRVRAAGGKVHHSVAGQPTEYLDGQVSQQPGGPGQVIAGVEDDQDAGSQSRQYTASMIRITTSRTLAAVTAVASPAGPGRTASSGSVHEVRPGSGAATNEYGQPGIICAFPLRRA